MYQLWLSALQGWKSQTKIGVETLKKIFFFNFVLVRRPLLQGPSARFGAGAPSARLVPPGALAASPRPWSCWPCLDQGVHRWTPILPTLSLIIPLLPGQFQFQFQCACERSSDGVRGAVVAHRGHRRDKSVYAVSPGDLVCVILWLGVRLSSRTQAFSKLSCTTKQCIRTSVLVVGSERVEI